ncbi:MAG: serine/threonine protein kinase [Planctomycetes bacterium]|nr:serine/threonine protein kinase [Planctomycetota bacterium]
MKPWTAAATVGEYRLVEPLGAGGMGEVWRVVHVPTGVERALKASVVDDPEAVLRFEREADAMARLDHPNVARVHTAGQAAGRCYLVMDLARGGDLASRLQQGPLAPGAARSLLGELARAVGYLHAQGILHRDLKPSNVVFTAENHPLLVDFGLVRQLAGSSLTQTGAILGTPSHMAPEQAEGLGQLDVRSDVYGLGAILFHVLTGRPPFVGATPLATLADVLSAPPPDPRAFNPRVPPDLADVCLQALAKDPSARPQSASAFAEVLAAGPAGGPGRTRWVVGLVAACALVVGAWVWAASAAPAESPPVEEALPLAGGGANAQQDPPQTDSAKVHPLDRVLGELELPRLADLENSEASSISRSAKGLLDGTSGWQITKTSNWLWDQGKRKESLALLYHVAQALPDDFSRPGWALLAKRLGEGFHEEAGWNARQWAAEGREVILECYRRGTIEANDADAWLKLGELLLEGSQVLGIQADPEEAVRCFLAVQSAKRLDASPLRQAWFRLAEIALDEHRFPGRPTCEDALGFMEEVVEQSSAGDRHSERAKSLAAKLKAKIAAGGD